MSDSNGRECYIKLLYNNNGWLLVFADKMHLLWQFGIISLSG